jgi:prepilin-type N-terminal cleavage/methylation domain-containing protein
MRVHGNQQGFTLIELLIVIAIILILIAIALPNFLEAQLRAKVARVRSEFRSIEVAVTNYRTQNPRYPFGEPRQAPYLRKPGYQSFVTISVVVELTTPIKFIDRVNFADPFIANSIIDPNGFRIQHYFYLNYETFAFYRSPPLDKAKDYFEGWALCSFGPDLRDSGCSWLPWIEKKNRRIAAEAIYSPTNGTRSLGDIAAYGGFIPAVIGSFAR